MGQMLDLLRSDLFYATQRQIIILRAFKADAKTAHAADQIGSVNAEVRDEVLRQKKLWVPIGFEIWIGTPTLRIELVLVAVEQLQFRIFVQSQGHKIKRGRRQLVVMIQQCHKIAVGQA